MRGGARAQGRVDPRALAGEGATRRTVVKVKLSAPAWLRWLIMGDRHQYVARVDAVDGSEFLDDRLRMTE